MLLTTQRSGLNERKCPEICSKETTCETIVGGETAFHLFKSEELDNTLIDGGMEAETSLVRAQS